MRIQHWIYGGLAAVAVVAAYGTTATPGSAPKSAQTSSALSSAAYTPTPGFVYYPAQYQNQATKVEDHVENF